MPTLRIRLQACHIIPFLVRGTRFLGGKYTMHAYIGFGNHTKNTIAGRFIPFLVLDFWDKTTGICAGAMPYRRDFSGHYQDIGISSLARHDSACNLILSVVPRPLPA